MFLTCFYSHAIILCMMDSTHVQVFGYIGSAAKCLQSLLFFIVRACLLLSDPENGVMNCSLRDDGVAFNKDICSFTCNTDYELFGSDTRTCQSDGSWSGSDTLCIKGDQSLYDFVSVSKNIFVCVYMHVKVEHYYKFNN